MEIIVLRLTNESRVAQIPIMQNLFWSYADMGTMTSPVSTRIVQHFHKAIPLPHRTALERAAELSNDVWSNNSLPIKIMETNETWKSVVKKATELYPKELASVKVAANPDTYLEKLRELEEYLFPTKKREKIAKIK